MTIIRDPLTGEAQRVNAEGKAFVLSEARTEARHASSDGDAFMISSGFAASPSAADDFTAVLYFKNTSTTSHVHIGYLRTCNEQGGKWRYTDNPTALGTTAITAKNMNVGDSGVMTATIQSFAAAGTTFADGTTTDFPQWIQSGPGHSVYPFDGALIIQPGQSFGLDFANFGTTAGDICVTMQAWIVTP